MNKLTKFIKRNSRTISTCISLTYSLLTILICMKYGWSSLTAHKLTSYVLLTGYAIDLSLPGHKMETKLHHSFGLVIIYYFIKMLGTMKYYELRPVVKYFLFLEITNIFNNYRSLSAVYKPKYKKIYSCK